MKIRLPHSFYNIVSYAGAAIAIIATFMFIFLYALSSFTHGGTAYEGIVIFLVIPVFIIGGLVLIPVGMIIKYRTDKKAGLAFTKEFPILDLNIPQHRNAALIFSAGTILFLFLSAMGSYQGYHFTESVQFCGTTCHDIMIPEYTAYQNSPHARVSCAECHVGAGANWYVKSKLSGLHQVYATIAKTYPRPIPTPVKNLRPARETCEECHWPQKTYGKQQRQEIHYLPNKDNTRWVIDILMNTGGGNPALGQKSGIHWHINPDIQIEYITTDEKRMQIPQVTMIKISSGDSVVFENKEEPLAESIHKNVQHRIMDCIDCHNRPSHIYRDPSQFINIAMASGSVSTVFPLIKQVAVEACMKEYETTEEAGKGIADYVQNFYSKNYPDLAKENADSLQQTILGIQAAFSKNIFPEMKVQWTDYPDHIGHMTSRGCFRCHDGKHVSQSGKIITNKCDACHSIVAQGPANDMQYASSQNSLPFKHPVDIGGEWQDTGCYECHSEPPI
ncbi:MAG: cytochrome C [Actinobacteria bacterium]|nr:cytochrome C [Actinomycetota bacterium]